MAQTPLWQHAVALYARPGVAPTCLRLQDTFGVDVVVLLTVLHALARGRALREEDIRRADTAVRDWRRDVVRALRNVRRHVKTVPVDGGTDALAALRRSVQAAELDAERIEFAMLDCWLGELPRGAPALSARASVVSLGRLSFGRPLQPDQERMLGAAADTIAAAFDEGNR
ncbi:MAG: TIGR02444 family protein [Bauldia sp.]|nr:TIGR02444 family protein [Bauldia sp.]